MNIKPDNRSASFSAFKRTDDPEVFGLAREREQDPTILSGKDMVYSFYKLMGMEIDYDDIFAD
ncbi:hypothetical protein [uncultured Methanobrevibacter sp.]|uniref:hypothetical protein n=1 Tax=uncultured Methanobrevibacter sp. TaxID=253161 RepID=UPI00260F1BD3|nr:hypothetical protein [uncultured Methanobrevibacter sp.]